jgi:hypothetical protein
MKTVNVVAFGGRAKAFYENGQAYVWDSVAGHYTTCHSLTANQVAYVRRLADRTEFPMDRIEALQAEAVIAGDAAQVALCKKALAGSKSAAEACVKALAYAEAQ